MDNIQLFRQFLSNKFKGGGKKHRGSRYNESTLPQVDPVEQYLNTPVGTHLIDNPMYTDEDITANNTPIIDSNTPVSEVVEDKLTVLPEVVVQGVSPQRKAVARSLIDYSMSSQPDVDWWNNEGKYWFNGTYQNAGDDTKKKALGGNLFYDGGQGDDEDIKAIIASQWPATSKVDYALKPQEGFSQFIDENGNPRGTIETIIPNQVATRWSPIYAKMGIPISERPLLEEANRVDYRDYDKEGNPIGEILMGKNYVTTNQLGQNTIVYNPQYTKIEDIKQDLLHVMHDDPEYEKLYDIYMTEALNDMDFLYHDFSEGDQREVESMLNGAFSKPIHNNLERGLNADSMLQAQLDGYLREQFYPGTPEERIAAGYTGVPYTIKNSSLVKAINNIKGYLEQKALGGPLFNSRTPIESFQGGRPLPIVRR